MVAGGSEKHDPRMGKYSKGFPSTETPQCNSLALKRSKQSVATLAPSTSTSNRAWAFRKLVLIHKLKQRAIKRYLGFTTCIVIEGKICSVIKLFRLKFKKGDSCS